MPSPPAAKNTPYPYKEGDSETIAQRPPACASVQITIRAWDPSSMQTKQVTFMTGVVIGE